MALNKSSNHLIDQAIDYYSWTLTFSGNSPMAQCTHLSIGDTNDLGTRKTAQTENDFLL